MRKAFFHPFCQFDFAGVGSAKGCSVLHLFVDCIEDLGMRMPVDKRAPGLNKVNQFVPIDIGYCCSRSLVEVDWIAMHRFERTNWGIDASDQMFERLVVKRV